MTNYEPAQVEWIRFVRTRGVVQNYSRISRQTNVYESYVRSNRRAPWCVYAERANGTVVRGRRDRFTRSEYRAIVFKGHQIRIR